MSILKGHVPHEMAALEREDRLRERTCAICNKGGSTTPVTIALQALGIAGNYAHPACLRRARRFRWFARYQCGCSADARLKRELLDYCGVHGGDRVECFRMQVGKSV